MLIDEQILNISCLRELEFSEHLLFILIANEFMEFTEDLEAFLFPEA
jgi:hypothetical protein